ncbi:hypothetical protein QFC21_000205 [Naganishia friedmannii]|uniref:Uncharacterized protein n=1 Tax=Naganishia friedmannii TaxID=89922 RepID=A0ACC2WCI2_9TREE|nr:hypothetical protein QFC21_000205 [Naganishia friedmannii]
MAPLLHASTTTPAKAQHYNSALSAALLAGPWGDNTLVKAPNGTALDWSESIRKWSKHTGGPYLPLGASSPSTHPAIPQLRSQPIAERARDITMPSEHRQSEIPPILHPDTPHGTAASQSVVLAPVTAAEGYHPPPTSHYIASNASTASSSEPSHVGTVQSLSTNSGGSTSTDRTESSSSFIHVSHPVDDESERNVRRSGGVDRATSGLGRIEIAQGDERTNLAVARAGQQPETAPPLQTSDSASASTVTPHTGLPSQAAVIPHHTETASSTALVTSPFLSPSYFDGDDAETGIPSLDPSFWWIGAQGISDREQRKDLGNGLQQLELMLGENVGRRSIAETRSLEILNAVDWTSAMDSKWVLGLGYQQLDLIRGKCLQGLSVELATGVSGSDHAQACYIEAIRLYSDLPSLVIPLANSFLVRETPLEGSALNNSAFTSLREAHRWISRALCRGSVLAARQPHVDVTLRFVRSYHAIAQLWPSTFRPSQRSFMLKLYLSALHNSYISHPSSRASPGFQWFVFPMPSTILPNGTVAQLWSREAVAAMEQGRILLGQVTEFPKAGNINWRVVEFMQACVRLWERSGYQQSEASQAIKVLWWAMSFTFQSQALLRDLTRLLYATGAHADALKTFELYVQLTLKARQTAQPEGALELKPKRFLDDIPPMDTADVQSVTGPANISQSLRDGNEDTDIEFIEALLLGSKILTVEHNNPCEAWRYLALAGEVVQTGDKSVPTALKARVEEAKGIARMAIAAEGVDPLKRPDYQAQGIFHLTVAVKLNTNTPSGFHHLAYANMEARQIDSAVEAIRASIELEPSNIPAWHLLALLLSARKDWSGALRATQVGVETWESREEELQQLRPPVTSSLVAEPPLESMPLAATISHLDFVNQQPDLASTHGDIIPPKRALIQGEYLVELDMPSDTSTIGPPRTAQRLAEIIQLRITQAVIIEKIDGQNQALIKQHETFTYLSNKAQDIREEAAALHESVTSVGSGRATDIGESFVAVPGMSGVQHASSFTQALSRTAIGEHPPSSVMPTQPDTEKPALGVKKHHFISRHLHVPGHRKIDSPGPENTDRRVISSGSSIYSRHTTSGQSHYQPSRTPPPPPSAKSDAAGSNVRSRVEAKLLAKLWLHIAATFRRSGQLDQAFAAIQEAEVADVENPEVWVQLGLYHQTMGDLPLSLETLTKAHALDPDSPQAVVRLAETYIQSKEFDMAHGLLNSFTQGKGWDVPEAWYFLAKACEGQRGRHARVRECLLYALELEKGKACRPLKGTIPRWIS